MLFIQWALLSFNSWGNKDKDIPDLKRHHEYRRHVLIRNMHQYNCNIQHAPELYMYMYTDIQLLHSFKIKKTEPLWLSTNTTFSSPNITYRSFSDYFKTRNVKRLEEQRKEKREIHQPLWKAPFIMNTTCYWKEPKMCLVTSIQNTKTMKDVFWVSKR